MKALITIFTIVNFHFAHSNQLIEKGVFIMPSVTVVSNDFHRLIGIKCAYIEQLNDLLIVHHHLFIPPMSVTGHHYLFIPLPYFRIQLNVINVSSNDWLQPEAVCLYSISLFKYSEIYSCNVYHDLFIATNTFIYRYRYFCI